MRGESYNPKRELTESSFPSLSSSMSFSLLSWSSVKLALDPSLEDQRRNELSSAFILFKNRLQAASRFASVSFEQCFCRAGICAASVSHRTVSVYRPY